jgi:hypothetical protein
MDEISLYYPYFHVRDDVWLKTAALCLPKVARLRPPDYPVRDSDTAALLRDELDFLVDIAPGRYAHEVAEEFLALVLREDKALLERYRVSHGPWRGFGVQRLNPWFQDETRFAWIHTSQLGTGSRHQYHPLGKQLRDMGLAIESRFDPLTGVRDDVNWVGMHPHLVAVYSCALAHRIAQANDLALVTHDPRLFALPSNWTMDELSATLLGDHPPRMRADGGGAAAMYAFAVTQAVVPADIEQLPAEKIVLARRRLSDEFSAFRAHLVSLGDELARIGSVEDVAILRSRLELLAERDLVKATRELERGLRALGLRPVRAVLGLKSLELPAAGALVAHAANLSPVVGAGSAVVFQLVASVGRARREAATQRATGAGYLLGLRRQLSPGGALARVRRALLGTF